MKKEMSTLKKTVPAMFAGVAMLFIALPASASAVTTITVDSTTITVECEEAGASTPHCQGFTAGSVITTGNDVTGGTQGTLSSTLADLYDIGSNNEANEAKALDYLIDGSFDNDPMAADGVKNELVDENNFSFDSTAEYIAFKVGAGHFFIALASPGTVNITFAKNNSSGGGLSHYTEFNVSPVPVPAAFWLFGTALIGFIGFSRRTKV